MVSGLAAKGTKTRATRRQLPITGSAHKATVVGDARKPARRALASLDVTAERCRAACRDRPHHASRGSVDGVLDTISVTVAAQHVRHLEARA